MSTNNGHKTIKVADVVFRDDLYPRIESSAATVQKYAEDLGVLPPIEVNELYELIDGWHRWTAHKKKKAESISAVITETGIAEAREQLSEAEESGDEDAIEKAKIRVMSADAQLLELAIERNARFGHQLSNADKKKMAGKIYRATPQEERGQKKQRLSEILSMSYDTVDRWLKRIDKDEQEARHAAIQSLYLQCYTLDEIVDATGASKDQVRGLTDEESGKIRKYGISHIPGNFAEDPPPDDATEKVKKKWEEERQSKIVEENTSNAEHAIDFAVPVYNVWKQQNKSEGSEHFGNSEVTWVDRLLYLYTQPFDIVVDPFAGGGSTLDICKTRFRRCFISDRKPIEERQKEIRALDLTEGLPALAKRWSEVRLVYLDPPYWKQAAGEYSEDPTDLANMDLETFNKTLSGIIAGFAKKLSGDNRTGPGYIALIIQPTQWKAPERQFTDHVGDMLRAVKLPVDMRFSVPYESQQCNAQMVEWAKENKRCLVLTREIVVWRVE